MNRQCTEEKTQIANSHENMVVRAMQSLNCQKIGFCIHQRPSVGEDVEQTNLMHRSWENFTGASTLQNNLTKSGTEDEPALLPAPPCWG